MDVRKAILIFAGTVFVGLGVVGMFLPLVPTTVFLLLAAYCYSRSSERFHTWLLNNRLCGRYIRNYKEKRGMSVREKFTSISVLWATILVSMWFVAAKLWIVALLAAVAIGVTLHLLWIKTRRSEDEPAELSAENTVKT